MGQLSPSSQDCYSHSPTDFQILPLSAHNGCIMGVSPNEWQLHDLSFQSQMKGDLKDVCVYLMNAYSSWNPG
jgi:hypothetical protein